MEEQGTTRVLVRALPGLEQSATGYKAMEMTRMHPVEHSLRCVTVTLDSEVM